VVFHAHALHTPLYSRVRLLLLLLLLLLLASSECPRTMLIYGRAVEDNLKSHFSEQRAQLSSMNGIL
jgi:hypothetical protein